MSATLCCHENIPWPSSTSRAVIKVKTGHTARYVDYLITLKLAWFHRNLVSIQRESPWDALCSSGTNFLLQPITEEAIDILKKCFGDHQTIIS